MIPSPDSPWRGRLLAALVVAVAVGGAVWVRLAGARERVFRTDTIRLQGVDAWYHARLAFALSQHPPQPLRFDPYAAYPDGQAVPFAGLPDALVAAAAWLVGPGRPDERTLDAVAALLPVVFGAGAVGLVSLLGGRLFGRGTGVIAALLLAFAPGPFFERTRPGWSDHHGAEAFLILVCLLVWVRGVATDAPRGIRRGLLMGLALAAYLLSWSGGTLLVLTLLLWVVAQRLLERRLGSPPRVPARPLVWASAVALALVALLPAWAPRGEVQITALLGLLAVVALLGVPRHREAVAPRWAVAGLLLAVAVAVWAAGWSDRLAHEIVRVTGSAEMRTVAEAQPLFVARGQVGWRPVWEQHGLSLLLFPFAFGWLARRVWRRAEPAETLLLVWSGTALLVTLFQNRFGYYLTGAVALLDAGLLARGLAVAARGDARFGRQLAGALAGLAIGALLGSNLWLSRAAARLDRAPGQAWFDALAWLREHSPEPFGDPAAYAEPARIPTSGPAWRPPPGAYGVMAWWDYGHWILKLGRRVPVASPTGVGAARAARFLLAQSEAEAEAAADGVRYVIVDHELPLQLSAAAGLRFGKLPAIASWAGDAPESYASTVFYRGEQGLRPVLLYAPRYYRTLMARLYLFGGEAVQPSASSWVVRTETRTGSDGSPWEELVEAESFEDYESARAQVESRPGARLVGLEPASSCVPLEALTRYRLVYEASQPGLVPGLPALRIFERPAEPHPPGALE